MVNRPANEQEHHMLLSQEEAFHFISLQKALMSFVDLARAKRPSDTYDTDSFGRLSMEDRLAARDHLLKRRDLLDAFIKQNPARLTPDDLAIVDAWHDMIPGEFFVLRELKKYAIFLSSGDDPVAFGVLGLTDNIAQVLGHNLPAHVNTILMPYKNRIVYDGLMSSHNVIFGPSFRRSLNEALKKAKARRGIVTSLPMSNQKIAPKASKSRPSVQAAAPNKDEAKIQKVSELVEAFCRARLNEEYALVCRRMFEKLAPKRPSPLLQGTPEAWACGIVRAVGAVNFLHDRAQKPYMPTRDIDAFFGVSQGTAAAKSSAIKKMFRLSYFDPAWTLPSKLKDNPLVTMFGAMFR
jgi:hypothetical protein